MSLEPVTGKDTLKDTDKFLETGGTSLVGIIKGY